MTDSEVPQGNQDGASAHDTRLTALEQQVGTLFDSIEELQGDIAALKVVTPAPKGFASWEQFDSITRQAYEQVNGLVATDGEVK